jgi:hypothetical protein
MSKLLALRELNVTICKIKTMVVFRQIVRNNERLSITSTKNENSLLNLKTLFLFGKTKTLFRKTKKAGNLK